MQIGKLNIQTPILLAPMAGVTDYPFRVLCKAQGAGVVYSEFVSAHGIIRENACLLYTSDAADDSLRVDLGGISRQCILPTEWNTHEDAKYRQIQYFMIYFKQNCFLSLLILAQYL